MVVPDNMRVPLFFYLWMLGSRVLMLMTVRREKGEGGEWKKCKGRQAAFLFFFASFFVWHTHSVCAPKKGNGHKQF
jgi:hypothetical protein